MKYSNFTRDKLRTSKLGFGLMRLPLIEGDNGLIDYKKSRDLVERALDLGVNYFDTAYVYHEKQSEIFAGEVFRGELRKRLYLATKLPLWKINKEGDFEDILGVELQKLQTDYIDFYLMHSLTKERVQMIRDHKIYDSMVKAKEEGKVRYIGFSFHDDLELFKEILENYNFDFCQIQLNYLDENYQAGLEGLRLAKEKGLGVVVMEPLRGGQLAKLPPSISKNLGGESPASLAFKYLLNLGGVDVILSGMNEISQIEENAQIFSSTEVGSLDKESLARINYLKEEIGSRVRVACTRCNYCMPCPTGVKIPSIFNLYNNKYIFEDPQGSKDTYLNLIEKHYDQSQCISCGRIESQCPQHLPIIKDLKDADLNLKGGKL